MLPDISKTSFTESNNWPPDKLEDQVLLKRHTSLRPDRDLDRGNEGVSIVELGSQ